MRDACAQASKQVMTQVIALIGDLYEIRLSVEAQRAEISALVLYLAVTTFARIVAGLIKFFVPRENIGAYVIESNL